MKTNIIRDGRVYYHGWVAAGIPDSLPGWRYYPERTLLPDMFVLRIYTGDRTLYIYGGENYQEVVNDVIRFPDNVTTEDEMKAWAIAEWRMHT